MREGERERGRGIEGTEGGREGGRGREGRGEREGGREREYTHEERFGNILKNSEKLAATRD